MKLIQLNIWQGKLLKNTVDFLKAQDADFVCLQEVYSSPMFVPVVDMFSSYEILQEKLNYAHAYYEPTLGFMSNDMPVTFGNAILSNHPFTSKKVIFTNGSFYAADTWGNGYPPNVRNALITEISTGSAMFTLVNHHGYHELSRIGSEITVEKMKVLGNELQGIKGPLILAADLNVTAKSPAMRVFDGWLEDLSATYNVRNTLTEFGKVHDVPCDHILVSKEVKVTDFAVSPALVSDHTPLILEFEI